jgi:hypothetical protein
VSAALKPPPPQRYPLPRPGCVADPESAAVGSRTEYAFAAPPEIPLAIVVFAVCRVWIKLSGEDSAAVSPVGSKLDPPPIPPDPISAHDRPDSETFEATGSRRSQRSRRSPKRYSLLGPGGQSTSDSDWADRRDHPERGGNVRWPGRPALGGAAVAQLDQDSQIGLDQVCRLSNFKRAVVISLSWGVSLHEEALGLPKSESCEAIRRRKGTEGALPAPQNLEILSRPTYPRTMRRLARTPGQNRTAGRSIHRLGAGVGRSVVRLSCKPF